MTKLQLDTAFFGLGWLFLVIGALVTIGYQNPWLAIIPCIGAVIVWFQLTK